jgi:L-ascorbate metabolism protein UlaG (beta-lactamase superfamily)
MQILCFVLSILTIFFITTLSAQNDFESDTIKTKSGQLVLTFIGHGTLMFSFNDLIIHVDPVSGYADYSSMPKADLILITHHHGDHLDKSAVELITKDDTDVILTETCTQQLELGIVMKNGDVKVVKGLKIEAVPAYNLVHMRNNGKPFHPKGVGNGYVITFNNLRVYVAGDTENFPEMKQLSDIDIAFLPMNLPYTMSPEMVADAVAMFNPKILYPYHYGSTDTKELLKLLKDKKDCEIRIRQLQ